MFTVLRPYFILIGSTVEGTKLNICDEADVTIAFKGLGGDQKVFKLMRSKRPGEKW
jgi:hypothetical protein